MHFWVEKDNIYYDINGIKNVEVISREELEDLGFIQYCRKRKIEDFGKDPVYFQDLNFLLQYIQGGLKYRAMPEYKKEIDDYLERIGFYQKRDELLRQNIFKTGSFML